MPSPKQPRRIQSATSDVRLCSKGYACGSTCISNRKVCLKKLGSNRAKEMAKRFQGTLKLTDFNKPQKKSTPDLVTDV